MLERSKNLMSSSMKMKKIRGAVPDYHEDQESCQYNSPFCLNELLKNYEQIEASK